MGALSFWNSRQEAKELSAVAPITASTVVEKKPAAKNAPARNLNRCVNNTEAKLILISIGQRRLWACEGAKTVHETPIITGNEQHAETMTPRGTYRVYAKQEKTTLTGSDITGSWRRGVYYWMPFLDNEYGTYGFHDATWRKDSDFGNIDPNTEDASHGCPELPMASQKWLYEWTPVKTTVSVTD